jgi:hypothetical protein
LTDRAIGFFDAEICGFNKLLRRQAPAILGLFGVGLGLLASYAVLTSNGYGCSCNWQEFQTHLGLPMLAGSLISLVGCMLYLTIRRASWIFLVIGAFLVYPVAFSIAFGLSGFLWFLSLSLRILITVPTDWSAYVGAAIILGIPLLAGLSMLLAGLATVPYVRHLIKSVLQNIRNLLHSFTERYYSLSMQRWLRR